MKRNILNVIVAIVMQAIVLPSTIFAQAQSTQTNSLAYLKSTFPKLTNLYNPELSNCHTHYIFAVDVSGSMIKYDSIVTPALKAFAKALPIGEQVSIIPFGTDPKENTPGLCTKIQGDAQKQVLDTSLSTLYVNPGYSPEFRRNTDVKKAIEAVNKAILNNQEVQMNVVVVITDFLNDLPGKGETKLTDTDLEKLNKDFNNVTDNTYTRVVAMQLPKAGTGKGFCLDQLQESVFCNTSTAKKFDIIQAINDQAAISHWFEQLSRDIMTEKLKAVIQLDNERNLHPSLKTKIDIDGNTIADIHWTPNKLYTQMTIEATETDNGSEYTFKNNKKVWQTTQDTALVNLKLGKLVHRKWGFRKFNENLNIGMSLPTPYDEELKRLSIDKPIQATSDKQSGWIFTFLLPFWWTVALVLLLLIYIILVIKCIMRNSNERFVGTVDFSDSRGRDIGETISVKTSKTLLIGGGGNSGCDLLGADWTIQVVKQSPSPLLVWKRPAFEWSAQRGFVRDGRNKKRGLLGRYGKDNTKTRIDIECGPDIEHLTHNVKITIKK